MSLAMSTTQILVTCMGDCLCYWWFGKDFVEQFCLITLIILGPPRPLFVVFLCWPEVGNNNTTCLSSNGPFQQLCQLQSLQWWSPWCGRRWFFSSSSSSPVVIVAHTLAGVSVFFIGPFPFFLNHNHCHRNLRSGFVQVGEDRYILRKDRTGDECMDYFENCYYSKEGEYCSLHWNLIWRRDTK